MLMKKIYNNYWQNNHCPKRGTKMENDIEKLFGFTIEELLIFAQACREQGITEKQLHDFAMNSMNGFKYGLEKFEEAKWNSMKELAKRNERKWSWENEKTDKK